MPSRFRYSLLGAHFTRSCDVIDYVTNRFAIDQFLVVVHGTDPLSLAVLASLDIPDCVYNWLVDYFSGHSHCTVFHGQISSLLNISASIIQGSAVGPVSYVVNAGDLTPLTPGNRFCKYADDTYLVIPASNINSRTDEIDSIRTWVSTNNLNLNLKKSVEIVFVDSTRRRRVQSPNPLIRRYSPRFVY